MKKSGSILRLALLHVLVSGLRLDT